MKNNNIKLFKLLLLFLLIGLFGTFYWRTVMYLPLYGDATIHGANANNLLEYGWRGLTADYPGFYSYMMGTMYIFLGEKGYNFVTYSSLILLLLVTFLFIRKMTNNYFIGLLSVAFVACSPKIIFYSARMYQEILLSAILILSIYLLFKYLDTRKRSVFYLLLFFTGISLSIKQQGLFILYSTLLFFFGIELIKKRINIQKFLMVIFIPLIIGIGFYGVLFHNRGVLMPGSEEFGPLRIINAAGQKIFFYKPVSLNNMSPSLALIESIIPISFADDIANDPNSLEANLHAVEKKYSERAFSRAESRHIWPMEVILNFTKFNQANNLFLDWEGKKLESPILFYTSFILVMLGFFYCLFNFRKYRDLVIFTLIFLPVNYILFVRNNDQQRYHMFIPVFLLVFIFIALRAFFEKIKINRYLKVASIICLTILIFTPLLVSRIEYDRRWIHSQLYTPSEGGIESVREVGEWIKENTDKQAVLAQPCGNEIKYYSNRQVLSDWRIYFLSKGKLDEYFEKNNIKYFVLNKSQITEDKDWHHICWVPQSFYKELVLKYKNIYTSNKNDVFVYRL